VSVAMCGADLAREDRQRRSGEHRRAPSPPTAAGQWDDVLPDPTVAATSTGSCILRIASPSRVRACVTWGEDAAPKNARACR
jgi:hypothetical protein